jgi:hypothetical protein
VGVLYRILGTWKNTLRSHALVFLSQQPAALALPREVAPEQYMVVFAKMSDNEIAIAIKKKLLVRKVVTDKLLAHYRANVDSYKDIPENTSFYSENPTERHLAANFSNDGPDSTIIRDVEDATTRPGHVQRLRVVEVSSSAAYTSAPRLDELSAFRVNRSSNLMKHHSREYELAAFAHLHPNGLGTVYDADRKVRVSPAEAKRHLLSLSNRAFATDPLWTLVNYDNSNKDKAQGLMSVRLNRDKGLASAGCQVSPQELQALVQHQADTRRAALSGARIPAAPPLLTNAMRVMSNIKLVQGTLHGSEQEREEMRRAMYAAAFQMGPGHAMFTLTPSETSNGIC